MFMATKAADSWLEGGLAFFYPEVCQICQRQRATAREGYVCGQCWSGEGGIQFLRPPWCDRCGLPFAGEITIPFECSNCRSLELHFDSARAAVAAKGLVLDVIHRYKYQRALWFEPFLADLFLRQAAPALAPSQWTLIVPVPLHPLKHREREFNQAERLARCLSVATKIPLNASVLQRVKYTRTQTQLSRNERTANVRNVFALKRKASVEGQRIVLVDDVFTTGATTSACARSLKAVGADAVCVWTLARGLG